MPTVQDTLQLPDGTNPAGVTVQIRLQVSTDGKAAPGYDTANDETLIAYASPTVTAGAWSATLVANSLITPAGTVYEVTTKVPGWGPVIQLISVPTGAGPYEVQDILASAPASLPAQLGHSSLTGTSVAGSHPSAAVSFDASNEIVMDTAADDDLQTTVAYHAGRAELGQHAAMRRWRTAIAERATKAARVAVCGDSITEGWFVSDRWDDQFLAVAHQRLADVFNGGNRGLAYVPAADAVIGTPAFSYAGQTDKATWGLALWSVDIAATTGYATVDVDCDRIRVFYHTANLTISPLEVYIDGVLATTITLFDNSHAAFDGVSNFVWDSGALAPGLHTIRFESSGASQTNVEAVYFHRGDYSAGVQMYPAGHFGYKISSFTGTRWLDNYANLDFDAVVIAHGTNDYNDGASTYETNLGTMIDEINAAADGASVQRPSIVVVAPWPVAGRGSTLYEPFRRAAWKVARTKGVAVIDFESAMGAVGTGADPYSLTADGTHPNVKGARLLGEYLAGFLAGHAGADQAPTVGRLTSPTKTAATAYTFALQDAGRTVRFTAATEVTATVPANSTVAWPVGTVVELVQEGAGQVTVAAAGGVTINAPALSLAGQHSTARLVKVDTDTWSLGGDVAAVAHGLAIDDPGGTPTAFFHPGPGTGFNGEARGDSVAGGQMRYSPFVVDRSIMVDAIGIQVAAAATSGKLARLGIVSCGADWQPIALEVDAGTVAIDSTGAKTITGLTTRLTPGRYMTQLLLEETATLEGTELAAPILGTDPANLADMIRYLYRVGVTWGAFADPPAEWTDYSTNQNLGYYCYTFLRWT